MSKLLKSLMAIAEKHGIDTNEKVNVNEQNALLAKLTAAEALCKATGVNLKGYEAIAHTNKYLEY